MSTPKTQLIWQLMLDIEHQIGHTPSAQEMIWFLMMKCSEIAREKAELKARFTAPIVCMCGSTKFKQAWISENARLTALGNIVLSVGLWGHHERIEPTANEKLQLDALHKRKIDLCDWVWVLDVGGYVGESTRSEIAYAQNLGRPVRYLSHEFPEYQEPIDLVAKENAELRAVLEMVVMAHDKPSREGLYIYLDRMRTATDKARKLLARKETVK